MPANGSKAKDAMSRQYGVAKTAVHDHMKQAHGMLLIHGSGVSFLPANVPTYDAAGVTTRSVQFGAEPSAAMKTICSLYPDSVIGRVDASMLPGLDSTTWHRIGKDLIAVRDSILRARKSDDDSEDEEIEIDEEDENDSEEIGEENENDSEDNGNGDENDVEVDGDENEENEEEEEDGMEITADLLVDNGADTETGVETATYVSGIEELSRATKAVHLSNKLSVMKARTTTADFILDISGMPSCAYAGNSAPYTDVIHVLLDRQNYKGVKYAVRGKYPVCLVKTRIDNATGNVIPQLLPQSSTWSKTEDVLRAKSSAQILSPEEIPAGGPVVIWQDSSDSSTNHRKQTRKTPLVVERLRVISRCLTETMPQTVWCVTPVLASRDYPIVKGCTIDRSKENRHSRDHDAADHAPGCWISARSSQSTYDYHGTGWLRRRLRSHV